MSTETVDPLDVAQRLLNARVQGVKDLKSAREAELRAADAVAAAQRKHADAVAAVDRARDSVAAAGWTQAELQQMGLTGRRTKRTPAAKVAAAVTPSGMTAADRSEKENPA